MHMVGILVDAHVGIWLIHSIDEIFWHIVLLMYMLMYMGVVHDGHTIGT
jgi:hypothetical protein